MQASASILLLHSLNQSLQFVTHLYLRLKCAIQFHFMWTHLQYSQTFTCSVTVAEYCSFWLFASQFGPLPTQMHCVHLFLTSQCFLWGLKHSICVHVSQDFRLWRLVLLDSPIMLFSVLNQLTTQIQKCTNMCSKRAVFLSAPKMN